MYRVMNRGHNRRFLYRVRFRVCITDLKHRWFLWVCGSRGASCYRVERLTNFFAAFMFCSRRFFLLLSRPPNPNNYYFIFRMHSSYDHDNPLALFLRSSGEFYFLSSVWCMNYENMYENVREWSRTSWWSRNVQLSDMRPPFFWI